jgi:Zn-dependent protease
MLSEGIPIGRIFGISIRLHISWFIIFALVTWSLAASYFPTAYPSWSLTLAIVVGLITSLLFFVSVLVHELMHSVVAQRNHIPVKPITLFVFGGVSQIAEEPQEPGVEFRVAVAGPLTSLILGGLFWIVYFLTSSVEPVKATAFWLGIVNLSLAAFNIVPAFPMDGGRVLRSIIWWRTRNLRRATQIASNIGRVVSWLMIFAGIYLMFSGNLANGLWLVFIGWFLGSAAASSYRQLVLQQTLQGHAVSEIMIRDCQLVPPDLSVERLVNEHVLPLGQRCFLVSREGNPTGLVTLQEIKDVPQGERAIQPVSRVMKPLDKLKTVSPDEDLYTVMQLLTEGNINQLPVMQQGKVVGMVARDNLLNFINLKGNPAA